MPKLYVALIHAPVVNKRGEEIASAVTNMDLHDIARASKTYGVAGYFVVTPIEDQQILAGRIAGHWTEGAGKAHNPDRKDALDLIRIASTIDAAAAKITELEGIAPRVIATSARPVDGAVSFETLQHDLAADTPHLLLFGTAWGLSPSVLNRADAVLTPIQGPTDYNHLSVRSAVSIILDRLLGR